MSELPGMWDESDLRGGETDCAEDLLIVRKLKEENAVLKEESERLKEGFKMSGHSANLANICREEWRTTAIEYRNEVVALKEENKRLKARVAELAAPDVQEEPVGWQFYQDGKWWNGDDTIKDHRKNTEEAGFRVRDVYAAPQPSPDVTALVEALECALEIMENVDGANDCSRGINAAEEALAAHRKQGGEA